VQIQSHVNPLQLALTLVNKPKVHPQGFWLSHEEGHASTDQGYFFDASLADELSQLLVGKSICDFGCGLGKYVQWFRTRGFDCDGFDGNPNTLKLTDGACRPLNLAEPVTLEKQYDVVISLEVGEHIPKRFEATFLDNLVKHARECVVISWAIPGQEGDGHVNCRSNSYIIYQLWRRGFTIRPTVSISSRHKCSLPWFKETVMIFSKKFGLMSIGEFKALMQIVRADIERLQRNNRSNSSFSSALIGKMIRTYMGLKKGQPNTN
jgi:SAM-dependent methyltransferase